MLARGRLARSPELALDPLICAEALEVGQPVRRGEPLLEVETDKAILVVESAITGTLRATSVEAGAEVATGEAIATFAVDEGKAQLPSPLFGTPALVGKRLLLPLENGVLARLSDTARRPPPRPIQEEGLTQVVSLK